MCNYRPQTKFAGRMFLHASVILFTGRGCACKGGGCAWQGGMHGTYAPLARTPPVMHANPPATHAPCHAHSPTPPPRMPPATYAPPPSCTPPSLPHGWYSSYWNASLLPCCVLNYTTNYVSLLPDNSVKYPKLFKSM